MALFRGVAKQTGLQAGTRCMNCDSESLVQPDRTEDLRVWAVHKEEGFCGGQLFAHCKAFRQ